MSKIAAAAHAPFITGASPSVMQMESWQELANPRDLTKIFTTPEYAAWRSPARVGGRALPGDVHAAFPGAAAVRRQDEPGRRVRLRGGHRRRRRTASYSWANAAYAMAVNINRSFKKYGWCSRIRGIESGGAVENLPTHTFPTDDGGVDMKCPTEIAISDRREAELSKNGFLSMIHRKNSDFAAFISGQSLQKPQEYDDADATANAALAARLPYLFACNRFAHYLKCIVRDKVGSFKIARVDGELAQRVDPELRRRRSAELDARTPRRSGRWRRRRSRSRRSRALRATTSRSSSSSRTTSSKD